MIIDGLSHPCSYSRNLLQISNSSAQHSGQPPKVRQQRPPTGRTKTRYSLEHRFTKAAGAAAAMAGDRETMCLITNALDQVQHRAVRWQRYSTIIARQVQSLLTHTPIRPLRYRGHAQSGALSSLQALKCSS